MAALRLADRLRAIFVLGGLLCVVPVLQAFQAPSATELEGTWTVASAERNGARMALRNQMAITFKGHTAVMKGFQTTSQGDEVTYTFEVDSKAAPKALTLKLGSEVISTVYELTGDTLRLVRPGPGTDRPNKVSSDTYALLVLKKAK